jgi:asparagine synthase (glutamine-hydrolysing)
MSIIVGIRKPSGALVSNEEVLHLAVATERYAADGTWVAAHGRVGMGFQPYHTHERSKLESQPLIDAQGNMLSFDGRIDNHVELRNLLDIYEDNASDSFVILRAFCRWREACFSKLIGDWALALWSAAEQVVYLARDHAGVRTLYFRDFAGELQWATYLDTFAVAGIAHSLDEQYAACYLAQHPTRDLTPLKGIQSVPAAHYLAISSDRITKQAHWEWVARKQIHHKSDGEYEEHFLSLFRQSVERRTGPGAPILAQVSGGIDSTSIVCVSDAIRRTQSPDVELLDTISFYDDTEPNWNERPYFSIVEAARGRTGIHLETSFMTRTFEPSVPSHGTYLFPCVDSSSIRREEELQHKLDGHTYRSILSGVGGDEVLGGVPTPLPELADYLLSGDFGQLFKQAFAWSFATRKPLSRILGETVAFTAALYWPARVNGARLSPWLLSRVKDLCAATANPPRAKVLGFRPSAISNGQAWWFIIETLPHLFPPLLTRYEYRYPYLDRDLIDYLFRIPREQLVRPGRRRSLMRRALRHIVPREILERQRKAFIIRGPLSLLRQSQEKINTLLADSLAAQRGLIDPNVLRSELQLTTTNGDPKWCVSILKTLDIELWMRANC